MSHPPFETFSSLNLSTLSAWVYSFTQNFITQGLTRPTSYLKFPTWMAVGITKLICTNLSPGAFLNLFCSVLSFFETASHFPVAQLKNLGITSVFFFLSYFVCDHTLNQMRSTLKIYLSWCGYMRSSHSWESGGAWFNVIPGIWRVCPPSQMYPEYIHFLLHLPLSKSQSSFIWFFSGKDEERNWLTADTIYKTEETGWGGIEEAEPFK